MRLLTIVASSFTEVKLHYIIVGQRGYCVVAEGVVQKLEHTSKPSPAVVELLLVLRPSHSV